MNYHNITKDDMNNGDGLRVTLWCSGCELHCIGCQNPQTWAKDSGILFDEDAKQEVFQELKKDYISGLTLSGGHPLEDYNIEELLSLVLEIKEKYPQKTIWLYTGFVFEDLFPEFKYATEIKLNSLQIKERRLCSLCDVLVDGPYIEEERDITLKWRGSKNQRVIDIKNTFKENKIILWCD